MRGADNFSIGRPSFCLGEASPPRRIVVLLSFNLSNPTVPWFLIGHQRGPTCCVKSRCDFRAVGLAKDDRFPSPFTQFDLASACAISAVHANRVIQELRREQVAEAAAPDHYDQSFAGASPGLNRTITARAIRQRRHVINPNAPLLRRMFRSCQFFADAANVPDCFDDAGLLENDRSYVRHNAAPIAKRREARPTHSRTDFTAIPCYPQHIHRLLDGKSGAESIICCAILHSCAKREDQ
jgi:hypothetical protein